MGCPSGKLGETKIMKNDSSNEVLVLLKHTIYLVVLVLVGDDGVLTEKAPSGSPKPIPG